MKFRFVAFPLALVALSFTASAETNRFDIVNNGNGKKLGSASYSLDKGKGGYKLHSTFDLVLNAGGKNDLQMGVGNSGSTIGGGGNFVDLQYSNEYKMNADGTFVSGYSQNSTNQGMITLATSKNRDSVTVSQTRARTDLGSLTLPVPKPDFFLLPSYDPGALQLLLTAALATPHADHTYIVVIPANFDLAQDNNIAASVTLLPEPDASGTLSGKPVTLKHYTLTLGANKSDIYTDDTGTLMEAVVRSLNATYVRSKFSLTPAP